MFGFPAQSWYRVAREGAWALAGQIAVAIAGLVGIRLLTELAPKDVFGETSLIFGALLLGRQVFLGPVMNAQLRYHPEYGGKGRARWFSREIGRLAWMSAAAFAIVGACAYLVWRGLAGGGWRPFLALALMGILVTDVAKALRLNRLNAERRQARYALWTGGEAWVWPVLSAFFLFLWTSTESYLAGQAAGSALALAVFGVILYPRIPRDLGDSAEPRGRFVRKMLSYGLPLAPLALVGWASNVGDRYILAGFMGVADVGLYAAACAVASRPFSLVSGAVTLAAGPVLFEAESGNRRGKARRVFLLWTAAVACLGAAGVLGFWLLGDWVAWLVLAEEYRAGAPEIFLWVAVGLAAFSLAQVLDFRLRSLGRSARLLPPAVLGAAASVLLAFVLVPRMGAFGAAKAKAIGFGVQLLAIACALATCRGGSAGPPRGEEPAKPLLDSSDAHA